MRMSLPSAWRHTCSMLSCMEVATKRPSGDQVMSRCEPFQNSISGAASVLGNHSVAPSRCDRASRKPFGAKARPRTLEGALRVRARPSASMTVTARPALKAMARRGEVARASIHLPLASASVAREPSAATAHTRPSSPPVSSRCPSLAATSTAPPGCTARRCVASPSARTTLPSPNAKTALSPSHAAAVTCASAATGATRSFREVAGADADTSGRAGEEAPADRLLVQVAANEDDLRLARLAGLPVALQVALEHHVHALEDETLGLVLEGEDALGAQDIGALALHEIVDPGHERLGIDRPGHG